MSQKLIFAIINYLFDISYTRFLGIELASISELKFGLDIFNILETKRFNQYFYI